MRLNRFIGNFDLSQKEVEIINPENIKQIKDVLRLKKGEKIILSDGKGKSAEVVITSLSSKRITGIINTVNLKNKINREITLYLAILKKENFELAVQKAVEVGVSEIVPVITERTIKTGLNIPRLEKIIIEASEQSGRNFVPALSPILKFKDALTRGNEAEEKIIFHLVENLYQPNKEAKKVSIFIGPEGGFTEKEINMAKDLDYSIYSLGSHALRAETAATVASYRVVKGI